MHGAVHRQGDQVQVRGAATGCHVPVPLLAVTGALSSSSWHSGTLSAFATIYREEGILGFFA